MILLLKAHVKKGQVKDNTRLVPKKYSSLKGLRQIIKRWTTAPNLTSHSLRIGWRSSLAILGVDEGIIAKGGRWATSKVHQRYVRVGDVMFSKLLANVWYQHFEV